jgi:hypothetical protein
MNGTRAIELLGEHQRKVRELLRQTHEVLTPGQPETFAAVATLRWQIMRALRAYQLFKHHEIFDPLVTSGNAPTKAAATVLKEQCLAIGKDYAGFVERWSSGAATADWTRYATEAKKVVRRIDQHLINEQDKVRLLIGNIDRTRHACSGRDLSHYPAS